MNRRAVAAFTLLELLIALALFAVLGLATWRLLDTTLRAEQRSAELSAQMRALQRALAVIERDLLQARTAGGRAALVLDAGLLNIHRGNWLNPLDQPRSDWQEVSFALTGDTLWRHSRGDSSSAQQQRLLQNISRLDWRIVDQQGRWHSRWPVARAVPLAVEMTLASRHLGEIRRLTLLPGPASGNGP